MRWFWVVVVLLILVLWQQRSRAAALESRRALRWAELALYQRLYAQAAFSQDPLAPAYALRWEQTMRELALAPLFVPLRTMVDTAALKQPFAQAYTLASSVAERIGVPGLVAKIARELELMQKGQCSVAVLDAIFAGP